MPRRNKRSQMHNLDDSFALSTMDIMISDACPWVPVAAIARVAAMHPVKTVSQLAA